jgi:hypothetical protein
MSGGVLIGWSPYFKAPSSVSYRSTISVSLKHKDCDFASSVVNVYDPYFDRVPFWEDLKTTGAFHVPFTIVGGI